uniref:Aminotransferase class V domain-containing protein n=1 Tax=Gopherus agassizii TaxID=38772 RepID=A0A452I870_9SAUR
QPVRASPVHRSPLRPQPVQAAGSQALALSHWVSSGQCSGCLFPHGAVRWKSRIVPIERNFCSRRQSLQQGTEGMGKRGKRTVYTCSEETSCMDLSIFQEVRLPTITTFVLPEGYDWKEVTEFIMNKHAIEISGGLGPSAGKVLRIGLMGYNSTKFNVDRVLHALKDALQHCHKNKL